MNKSLSSVNLNLELHVVSTFWLEYDRSSTFSLYFAQPSLSLRDQHSQPWRFTYFGVEHKFVAANFLQKYPWCLKPHFQFHLFVNWTISAFVSSRLARKYLQIVDSLQRKPCIFKVTHGVFGRLVNFSITYISLLRRSVFPDYLSVSCDYALS